jgi:hypothetical protein
MALECGSFAWNCVRRHRAQRAILHQKANRVLQPLNGYRLQATAQPAHAADAVPATEIAPILAAVSAKPHSRSTGAARLMRRPLGGHERTMG